MSTYTAQRMQEKTISPWHYLITAGLLLSFGSLIGALRSGVQPAYFGAESTVVGAMSVPKVLCLISSARHNTILLLHIFPPHVEKISIWAGQATTVVRCITASYLSCQMLRPVKFDRCATSEGSG